MKIVATSVLTYTKDPQRPNFVHKRDNFAYFKEWYESVSRLGLEARIYHNPEAFSSGFIDEFSTRRIQFVKVTPNDYTPADFRWLVYADLVGYEWAVFTDASDVVFRRDPFEEIKDPNALYIGTEAGKGHPSPVMIDNDWMRRVFRVSGPIAESFRSCAEFPVYNCGIIGGHALTLMPFLRKMSETMRSIDPTPEHFDKFEGRLRRKVIRTVDMAVLNHCAFYHNGEIVTGHPLHNRYKFKKSARDLEAAIWHK